MESIFLTAALWLALVVVSALIASSLRLSIALIEICVGVVAAAATGFFGLGDVLAADAEWVRFLAASGAVVLTFLAGAELDPDIVRKKLTEVSIVGLVGFLAPFLGCAALAYYVLGGDANASWLCGVALSTTSLAVVYAVMLETGSNKTESGKGILASCFVTDLGTVIALGLLIAPFTYKRIIFIVGSAAAPIRLRHEVGSCSRSRSWRGIGQFILWICVLGSGMVSQSEAAEWSLLPSIGVKGVYTGNVLLTTLPHHETYGYWVSPAAEFAGKIERLEVSGRVAADFVSYYRQQEGRFTNLFLPLTLRYKTETDLLGFTGGFTRDNTLMSELQTTGVVLRFTQRNQWTANPSWTRSITDKLSVQSSFQLNDTTYENGLALGLVDYQLYGGSGGLLYQLTPQHQIQLSASYTSFHTTNAPSPLRASFPGVNLSLTHAFTESLTGTAYGGPSFVSSTNETVSGTINAQSTVWLFGGNLTKKFESATIQVSASRNIVPSGFGLLIQTDRAGLAVSHDLSETLTASFDGSGYFVSGITQPASGGTFPDSRYFYLTPKIAWKFLDWWKLDLSYTYRWSDVDGSSEPATSNGYMLMLTYFPPKLALFN